MITPAAIKAALSGNVDNFIAATTPGGIEAQEKRGQIQQCFAETLPIDGTLENRYGREPAKAQWEALGFVFRETEDDLFVKVKFPEGWRKQVSEHSMWTYLLDGKGRRRASIFYKAAFYDRSAHVSLERRFCSTTQPVGGWESESRQYIGIVKEGDVVVFQTTPTESEPQYAHDDGEYARQRWLTWSNAKDAKGKEAEAWLVERYPDYQNPIAYWD